MLFQPEFAFYYAVLGVAWFLIICGWLIVAGLAISVFKCRSTIPLWPAAALACLLLYAT